MSLIRSGLPMRVLWMGVGAAIGANAMVTNAWAQAPEAAPAAATAASPAEARPTPAAPDGSSAGVEEVVITAERRAQNMQEYAGVAQAISGDDLKAVGINRVEDLQAAIPGLNISNQEGNVQIYLRGVGTSNNTELGDPSAAMHFNGVYLPRPRGVGGLFFDLDRVEVAKGPQGTLRGRNAVAGTLNILPVLPKLGETSGYVEAVTGNYNAQGYEAAVNTPLTDIAAVRVAVYDRSTDSPFKNVGNDSTLKPTGISDQFSTRASLLVEPNDELKFVVIGDYEKETGTGYPAPNVGGALRDGRTPEDYNLRELLYRGVQGEVDSEAWGVSLQSSYDFGPVVLEYNGSHRALDFYQVNASSEGVIRPGLGPDDVDYDNRSGAYWLTKSDSDVHELRLTSGVDSTLIWSAGLFYFKEKQQVGYLTVVDNTNFYNGSEFTMPDVNSESKAAYLDLTYPFTDALRGKAGFRHTKEDKSRYGIGGNWAFGFGGADPNFACCFTTRLGTQGFRPAFMDRQYIDIPDVLTADFLNAFAADMVGTPGLRDTLLQQLAGQCIQRSDIDHSTDADPSNDNTCTANGGFGYGAGLLGTGVSSIPSQQRGRYKDTFNDWRVGFEFDATDRNLIYGTISTGHKSGGFNDTVLVDGVSQSPIFEPEVVTLYELGSKNRLYVLDHKLDLNANVFWYDYADQVFQTLVAIGGSGSQTGYSQQNVNVANSTIRGIEIEAAVSLPYRMRVDANLSYIDATIDNGALFDTRANDYGAGTPNYRLDISGNRLPLVSKFNLSMHMQQNFQLFGGNADWHLLTNYRSSYYLTQYNESPIVQGTLPEAGGVVNPYNLPEGSNLTVTDARSAGFWGKQKGFVTFNAGLGWTPSSGTWRLEAYSNNVFNKTIVEKQLVSDINTNILFINQARTYGLRLRAYF